MKCAHPVVFKNTGYDVPLPCGRCSSCTTLKKRVWSHRMMLEMREHDISAFVTLTYNDENLPEGGTLEPDHIKKFMWSLRKKVSRKWGTKLRFYAVGEYGDKDWRPHYHLALFGYRHCIGHGSRIINSSYVPCSCPNCSLISKTWGKGHISLDPLNIASAQYIAGYVTKKLTKVDDFTEELLNGRHPEFARQSRNPGLGSNFIESLAERIKPHVTTREEVLPYLVHDGKKWPMGRYLYNKLLEALGFPPLQEGEAIKIYKKNLRHLFETTPHVSWSKKALLNGLPDVALRLINAQRDLQLRKKDERNHPERKRSDV